MSKAQIIAEEAEKGALEKSSGYCLRYVAFAIQRAHNQLEQPIGIESAKDGGPYLKKKGYGEVQVVNNQYKNGDVIIFSQSYSTNGKCHPHGHIQIYKDGRWYSDFKQNNFSPYADRHLPSYKVYRIKQQQNSNCKLSGSKDQNLQAILQLTSLGLKPNSSPSYSSSTSPSFSFGGSSSSSGWGLSTDRSNYGYTFDGGSRISGGGGFSRGGPSGNISISIPCSIM